MDIPARVPMPDGDYTMIAASDGRTIGGYFASPDPASAERAGVEGPAGTGILQPEPR